MIPNKEIVAMVQRTDGGEERAGSGIVVFFTRSILPEINPSF